MSAKVEKYRQQILNKLASHIKKHASPKKAELLSNFIKQYYAMVSYEDLASQDIETLYGAMLSHWDFMYERKPRECKVRVFNPDYNKHGWETTHTVIEIAHDDMPFLVDSVRLEINRHGYLIHNIIHLGGMRVRRSANHRIMEILPRDKRVKETVMEAPIFLEIDRQTDPEVLVHLQECLERVLSDVSDAVNDWDIMLERLDSSLMELEQSPPPLDPAEITESKAFLRWLKDNFIMLGCRDYKLKTIDGEKTLEAVTDSGAGVLHENTHKHLRHLSDMPPEARKLALSPHVLIIAKTNTRSTVHRAGYTDYVGVKMFDKAGNWIGERRFIGLYTSSAYHSNPKQIPFLRLKVAKVLQKANFAANSHAGKNLLNILETLPRDDLFQASPDELLDLTMGIFHLQERQRIRLFMRKDSYGRFYSCLVYVPSESFNTELTLQMQEILREMLNGEEVTFSTLVTESILARIHFMVRVKTGEEVDVDPKDVEKRLIEVGMSWRHEFHDEMVDYYGEAKGIAAFNRYRNAFLASYREAYSPRTAVHDIEHIEELNEEKPLSMNFYQPADSEDARLRFKVYQKQSTIPLSDALPILENLGFRVINERPHRINLRNGQYAWINDFDMTLVGDQCLDVERVRNNFQRAFAAVWLGKAENDSFNHLIVSAQLNWREVTMLRAYARYFQQTGFTFSQAYIAETLVNNAHIAKQLVQLFDLKFAYKHKGDETALNKLVEKIEANLEEVANLGEDRILRYYLSTIKATLRTNYYKTDSSGMYKSFLSLKLKPDLIPDLPLPRPMFEIFVYSSRFEGVHLRGAKVARGGLRWSDRPEDFRTEVLGLMKAQQVKNAVIVPLGAKGGFVAKQLPVNDTREAFMAEGITCYQNFIRGLLDVTDNIVDGEVVSPEGVVCYDEEDPYLVVAADKGTATFSDIANEISKEYDFWLGDAFASGGSAGYDHKKMGITARGAWESVKRHFREMDVDTQSTDFTAVGIGDMSGDVFGNGMLLSKHIKLLAAFNHLHIFVDPNPNAAESYKERKRLFNLPRSSWSDYDPKLISKGGGVFKRTDKSVRLTSEMKKMLGVKRDVMTPTELISFILKAEVDLLWNGGIGTYVKASNEINSQVGDRANDGLRVNGNELRCKVVGEGGNLGLTQLARVEYALNGGRIYTDFIDNSAGVDCSDHEVNIKILLNQVVSNGDMTEKQRNNLLASMTDEVGELVLENNYEQTQAISLAVARSVANVDLYERFIAYLEKEGRLDRSLEFLPATEELQDRKVNGKGLTAPEIAVLFAYSKTILKENILATDVPENPYFEKVMAMEFPKPLRKKYAAEMQAHSLRREIIATQLSNLIINEMGITFVERLQEEAGESVADIVKAFITAQLIFDKKTMWRSIESLDLKAPVQIQFAMMRRANRLIRRSTRWLLRYHSDNINIEELAEQFKPQVMKLRGKLLNFLTGEDKLKFETLAGDYTEHKVPQELAENIAVCPSMIASLDIVEVARVGHFTLDMVANTYFTLGDRLGISWVREQIINYKVQDRWAALARSGFRDDLDFLQRMLTMSVLKHQRKQHLSFSVRLESWLAQNEFLIQRWEDRVADMRSANALESIMFSVALRELLELVQANRRLVVFR